MGNPHLTCHSICSLHQALEGVPWHPQRYSAPSCANLSPNV